MWCRQESSYAYFRAGGGNHPPGTTATVGGFETPPPAMAPVHEGAGPQKYECQTAVGSTYNKLYGPTWRLQLSNYSARNQQIATK